MPFHPGRFEQGQLSRAARDAELEWLLCLASALEACKKEAYTVGTLPPRRADALQKPPHTARAKKSQAA
jgi:hypothetical protein